MDARCLARVRTPVVVVVVGVVAALFSMADFAW